MADSNISTIFNHGLKQCLICGDFNIDMRKRFKNALNCWFCPDCYIGSNKVKCRDCKKPIEIEKDYTGQFKTRCWMCYLARLRTKTSTI